MMLQALLFIHKKCWLSLHIHDTTVKKQNNIPVRKKKPAHKKNSSIVHSLDVEEDRGKWICTQHLSVRQQYSSFNT